MASRRAHALSICAVMKDEATNALEWVAFHHALGVERFHLYDNGSTDGTAALLAPLVRAGLVELTPWPERPAQVSAYEHFAAAHGACSAWTAFIDLDEFINPFAFDSIPEWLGTLGSASAVAIQWLNFGPAGHETPPPGLLIEAYPLRLADADPVHGHVKTLVRMDRYVSCLGAHAFAVDGEVVDERGEPVVRPGGGYAVQPVLCHDAVCLNHYYTRSRAQWVRKVGGGRADNADPASDQRQLAWFDHYAAHATVRDVRIQRFAPRTRAMLARFAELPS